MNILDYILKLNELTLSAFIIWVIMKAVFKFAPDFIAGQKAQAEAMGRLAEVGANMGEIVNAVKLSANSLEASADTFRTTMKHMAEKLTEDNKEIIILLRAQSRALNNLPCRLAEDIQNEKCPEAEH